MISDYLILTHLGALTLQEEVVAFIKKGWEPLGSIQVDRDQRMVSYVQPMVRREPENSQSRPLRENSDIVLCITTDPGDIEAWGEAAEDSEMSLNAWANWKLNG